VAIPLIVIDAGTWTTGTLLSLPVAAVAELVWVKSPPPQARAVFDTEVGELDGTFTMIWMVENAFPPATACVDVQFAVPVPEHDHPEVLPKLEIV